MHRRVWNPEERTHSSVTLSFSVLISSFSNYSWGAPGKNPRVGCHYLLQWTMICQKEIKLVNPKGNQRWIFTGRTDAEAPILRPLGVKSQPIGKDPAAGKDWRQKEQGAAEMRWLDGITDSVDMNLSKLWETVGTEEPGVLQSTRSQRAGHDLATGLYFQLLPFLSSLFQQLLTFFHEVAPRPWAPQQEQTP